MSQKRFRTLVGLPFLKVWPVLASYEARAVSLSKFHMLTLAVYPLAYLLLLGGGISGLASGGTSAPGEFVRMLAHMVPGLIAMQANAPFATMMYRYQGERQAGLLALKLVQGVSPVTYLVSMTTVPVLQYLGQSLVVIAGALALGVRMSPLEVTTWLGFGIIAAVTWACLGGWLVFLVKRQNTRMAITSIISLPLVFSAPIFYSFESMPAYLRTLATVNPLTYQVELMRGGGQLGFMLSFSVTLGLLLVAVAVLAALIARSEPLPGHDHT